MQKVVLLSLILALAIFMYGTVDIWSVSIVTLLLGIATIIELVKNPLRHVYFDRKKNIILGLLLFFIFIQLIPLPISIVSIFSPHKAAFPAEEIHQIKAAPISVDVLLNTTEVLKLASYIMFGFLVVRIALSRIEVETLFIALIIPVFLNATYGIYAFILGERNILFWGERVDYQKLSGMFVNANHFVASLEILIPACIIFIFINLKKIKGRVLLSPDFYKALVLLYILIIFLVSLIFAKSRMGLFSFAASIWIICFLLNSRKTLIVTSILLAVIAIAHYTILHLPFVTAAQEISIRTNTWAQASKIIYDHPVFGTGFGAFASIFPIYQAEPSATSTWTHPHNEFVAVAVELGIPMFLFVMMLLIGWYRYTLSAILYASPRERQILIAVIGGVSGLIIHNNVDFNFRITAVGLLFSALIGIGFALAYRIHPKPAIASRPAIRNSIIWTLICSSVAICCITIFISEIMIYVADKLPAEQIENKLNLTTTANTIWPFNPDHRYNEAEFLHLKYEKWSDEFTRRSMLTNALNICRYAVILKPLYGKFHWREGVINLDLGREAVADKEIEIANRLDPLHYDQQFKIGAYYWRKFKITGNKLFRDIAMYSFEKAGRLIPYTETGDTLTKIYKLLWVDQSSLPDLERVTPYTSLGANKIGSFLIDVNQRDLCNKLFFKYLPEGRKEWAHLVLIDDYAEKLHQAGWDAEAIEVIEKRLELEEKAWQSFVLGNIWAEQGVLENALSYYDKARKLDPRQITFHLTCASGYRQLGRYEEAIKAQEDAIKLEPLNPDHYVTLAIMYEESRQEQLAKETYIKALRYDQANRTAAFRLTNLYMRLKDYESAESTISSYIIRRPQDIEAVTMFKDIVDRQKK